MLRAVLCTLALGMDTTGAFCAPGGLATGRRAIELKGTNDMHGGPPAEAAVTNEVSLVLSRPVPSHPIPSMQR